MDALSTLLQQSHYLRETKCYFLNVSGNWAYSITSNGAIYFYLVKSGSFYISTENVSRKIYAGDIIMIPDAYKHICYAQDHPGNNAEPLDKLRYSDEQCTMGVIQNSSPNAQLILIECQYDKEFLQPLLSVLPAILPEHDEMHESRFKALDGAIGFISLESEYERLGKLMMINLLANIIMMECLRTHIESLPERATNWLVAMRDPYLSKALAIMHETPNHKWTTHELAKKAGMSRSGFTQRFKNKVGVPPLTYLTDYRLRLAVRHLRLQKCSIARVSELVGYASNSAFSQAFKRVYGVSPKEYQHQQRDRMII